MLIVKVVADLASVLSMAVPEVSAWASVLLVLVLIVLKAPVLEGRAKISVLSDLY